MQPDGSPPDAPAAGDGAVGRAPTNGTGARVTAVARIALGSVLLARGALARLLDDAVAAGRPDPAVDGAASFDGAVLPLPGALTTVTATAVAAVARVPSAVVAVTPTALRAPVARRVLTWRAAADTEQERSQAVAAATLETAVTFMTDWIVERLDVNRIVERLQLDDIIAGLELTDVIVSSTESVSGRVLDSARSRAADADALVDRILAPLRGRSARRQVPTDGAAIVPTAPA